MPSSSLLDETSALVLVVDDHEDTRDLSAYCLESAGCRVQCAQDGAEAIAKARELTPDVIFMDLSLPIVDGWEVTRILKRDPATRDIYIVALSGHARELEVDAAMDAGVDEYIVKPLEPMRLANIVERRTRQSRHA